MESADNSMAARNQMDPGSDANAMDKKFGTFAGVFVPTILTILGAIMYLRAGWVIGNAGLLGGISIILLAHVITVCTGLSVASIATNTRVGAGGAFAIISKSLGFEVGGAIGIPLYLAQGISVAFYVLAFTEGWAGIFPKHPFGLAATIAFLAVFGIAYVSAQFASRIQFIILAIIGLSLISILLGSFTYFGGVGMVETPVMFGTFSQGNYWKTFAIFFPAVTGIMAGISMSGSLREPSKALPIGTIGAVAVGLVTYLALAYWLATVATTEELLDTNRIVMADKALWSWAVFAGLLGATFSSALGSLVAAPRVMQALAAKKLIPASSFFAQETTSGDPRQATIFTAAIGLLALFVALGSGGLDAIADILTMFFLITYGMLNIVVLIEQILGMVSFRPTFRVPVLIPFFGMAACLFTMLLVNPTFTLFASIIVVAIYAVLSRRNIGGGGDDVRSGLFSSLARWAVLMESNIPAAPERSWSPQILAPIASSGELSGSYRFLRSIAAPQGMVEALAIYAEGDQAKFANLDILVESLIKDKVMSRAMMLEENDFSAGVKSATQILRHTFFRPNILFFNLHINQAGSSLAALIDRTVAYKMGIVLLARDPIVNMGREKVINVWLRPNVVTWIWEPKLGNKDLSLLLAHQIRINWRGDIRLCLSIEDESQRDVAQNTLSELVRLTRFPKSTSYYIHIGSFDDAFLAAPTADLSIIGLPDPVDLHFCYRVAELINGSCVFVRDSGEESAFA